MTATPYPLSARHKGFNRAEIVDQNFTEFVQLWDGDVHAAPRDDQPVLPGSALDARGFRELLGSQLISRHLDLMARVLRVQNKVFYTIGSSGHEGNAMVARLTRHTDPAFLHYRSGGFMAERFRKLPDQRLSGDGSMVARYDMDLHVALGQTTPTKSRIHGEVGQQLHTRAEQCDWHRGRHWP